MILSSFVKLKLKPKKRKPRSESGSVYYRQNARRAAKLQPSHRTYDQSNSSSSSEMNVNSRISRSSVLLQQHSGVGVHQEKFFYLLFKIVP